MRLLAVRLQNLNSLSGTHEVRFDTPPLSAVGVFLITGPTGAGKSTLLDAMTLALYGRAARYGNDKADEMMSGHTAECMAEVDFEAGGEKLRATWRMRRARGRADGKLQPVERRLADAVSGEIIAEKSAEMDRLIEAKTGLDSQRFLRSVLLAQGQFASFLKAKPNERAELLERITGTEIYRELSVLAHEVHREKEEHAHQLRTALGNLLLLEAEARVALESRLAEAKAYAEQLTADKEAAAAQLRAEREHAQIAGEMAGLQAVLQRLQENHVAATAETADAKAACDTAKQQRTQREPVWEKAAGLAAQSDQFETQLTESRAAYQTHAREHKEAGARRDAAEKSLLAQQQAMRVLDQWLQDHASDAALAETLPRQRLAVREWRAAFEALTEARKSHAASVELKQKLAEMEAEFVALQKSTRGTEAKVNTDAAEMERLGKSLDAQRELVRQAELVAKLDEHRHDLKPGEPCPLCGATEHPWVASGVNAGSQLHAARTLLKGREAQHLAGQQALVKLQRALTQAETELKSGQGRIAEMKKRLVDLKAPSDSALQQCIEAETRCRVSLAATPTEAEQELDKLEKRANDFIRQQQLAVQKRSERQQCEAEVQLASQLEQAKAQRLEELKQDGVSLRAKADALKAQLHELLGGRSLSEDRQLHEQHVATAEKAWQEVEGRLAKLRTELTATQAKLDQLELRRQPFAGSPVPTPETLALVEAQARQLHEAFAAKRTEVGSLEQQLKIDDDAIKRRAAGGDELRVAEAEALRWGRLKELIGAADGSRFARFAQSLSLRQLISLANRHLGVLAPRYRLIAAEGDGLDLRIVDLYQAAVERPMESLSGGESFLASLALALGLSELASRHHPIDSLFIDEGFGTLDAETLEIALSALENLRATGKTIGVISHVEMMKERLGTQIRVQRHDGGRSSIEVV